MRLHSAIVTLARAMALVMLALPGTVFIYNGEELGLPEVDLPRHLTDVAHHGRFGDFHLQCRGCELVVAEALDHVAGEVEPGELQWGDIEGDAHRVEATVLPFAADRRFAEARSLSCAIIFSRSSIARPRF